VGWRRWAAVLLGLVGVIVIVQPGTDSFFMLSILAIIGIIGFAGRDLATRAAPVSLGTLSLGLYGFLSIVAAGLLFSAWEVAPFVKPGVAVSFYLLGAVLTGVAAYS
jgi:drug/metabolite transporter (DMT)-like permease